MRVRQDGEVTEPSLLQAAVDELYSQPMSEFTARRKALSAAARKTGDRDTATQIAGLRKPTLSADTVNRLVRSAPDELGELLDLGAELRAAEKALDGAALRELSTRRRQLVNDLTRLAFELTEQSSPSPSVRDEVTATLNAALADKDVADRLISGALVTQARWDGFGSTSLPELAAVLPMDPNRRRRTAAAPKPSFGQPGSDDESAPRTSASEKHSAGKPSTAGQRPAGKPPAAKRSTAAADRAEDAQRKAAADAQPAEKLAADRTASKARAERELGERIEAAEREATEADDAAQAAQQKLGEIDRRISELNIALAHQRELLAAAQKKSRTAETRRRTAHLALTRAGGAIPGRT